MADILQIVDTTASLSADETAVQSSLTGAGHTVTLINASDPVPGNISSYDGIIAGPETTGVDLGSKYRDIAVPAIVLNAPVWRNSFSMGSGSRTPGSASSITVEDDTHPIAVAAGLTNGPETIYSSGNAIVREDLPDLGPDVYAFAYQFSSERKCLFTYDTGDTMANSITAPARRVGVGIAVASIWTATGESIFLESVNWAAELGGGGGSVSKSIIAVVGT